MSSALAQPERGFAALRARPLARAALTFALLCLCGLFLWPLIERGFATLFRELCNLVLAPHAFGRGGHVAFVAAAPEQTLERAASWDVRMVLSVEGVSASHGIALNPRRLLYLPLLTLAAAVGAAPVATRVRRRALTIGSVILIAHALASVFVIAAFLFARVPGLVYSPSPFESSALRLGYEGWVTPLTNKFIVPLLLAYALMAWRPEKEPARADAAGDEPAKERVQTLLARSKPPDSKVVSGRRRKRSSKKRKS